MITISNDYFIKCFLIVNNAFGKLDLVLRDAITSITENAQGTADINYYRHEMWIPVNLTAVELSNAGDNRCPEVNPQK